MFSLFQELHWTGSFTNGAPNDTVFRSAWWVWVEHYKTIPNPFPNPETDRQTQREKYHIYGSNVVKGGYARDANKDEGGNLLD